MKRMNERIYVQEAIAEAHRPAPLSMGPRTERTRAILRTLNPDTARAADINRAHGWADHYGVSWPCTYCKSVVKDVVQFSAHNTDELICATCLVQALSLRFPSPTS